MSCNNFVCITFFSISYGNSHRKFSHKNLINSTVSQSAQTRSLVKGWTVALYKNQAEVICPDAKKRTMELENNLMRTHIPYRI